MTRSYEDLVQYLLKTFSVEKLGSFNNFSDQGGLRAVCKPSLTCFLPEVGVPSLLAS